MNETRPPITKSELKAELGEARFSQLTRVMQIAGVAGFAAGALIELSWNQAPFAGRLALAALAGISLAALVVPLAIIGQVRRRLRAKSQAS